MAFVIVDGAGTFWVGEHKFNPGANECSDPEVLEAVDREGLDWVYTQKDRSTRTVEPEPVSVVVPEVIYEAWQGRDGKWYFLAPVGEGKEPQQSEPYDTEADVYDAVKLAKEEAEKVPLAGDVKAGPESGELTKDEFKQSDFPCKEDGCDKVFKDSGARTNHERLQKHGAHAVKPKKESTKDA